MTSTTTSAAGTSTSKLAEPGRRYGTLSFLTDYGLRDEFVGVVKSVIASIAPDTPVVDVSHAIAPHDVRAGGLALARAAQYLMPGVVLAVVDPGVGTDRRAVAVEVGGGVSVLVGPDNGLLAPAVAMVGGATRAFDVTQSSVRLAAPGPTFDGRDLFAPVAAHLCAGVPIEQLGVEIAVETLMPAVMPVAAVDENGEIMAEALWIDHFGNVQLNLEPDDIPAGVVLRVRAGERSRPLVRATSFEGIPSGSFGLLVDSYGMPAIAVNRGSAARDLNVHEGDEIRIIPGGPSGAADEAATVTTVELGRRPDAAPSD